MENNLFLDVSGRLKKGLILIFFFIGCYNRNVLCVYVLLYFKGVDLKEIIK